MPGHPVVVVSGLKLFHELVPGFDGVLLGRFDRNLAEDVVFVSVEDDVRREDEAIPKGRIQVDLGSQLVDQGLRTSPFPPVNFSMPPTASVSSMKLRWKRTRTMNSCSALRLGLVGVVMVWFFSVGATGF